MRSLALLATVLAASLAPIASSADEERTLVVTATAYNSLPEQTEGDPTLGAWGDRLEPGMRAIAVSRDLIELGLGHGARVRIEGLEGEYVVLDKMAARWRQRIDLFMAEDVGAARAWGRRQVRIHWGRGADPSAPPPEKAVVGK